jgi:hypothetical protein
MKTFHGRGICKRVLRREKMRGNVTEQLLKDVSSCVAFSFQLDESTDIRHSPVTGFYLDGFLRFQRQKRTTWNDFLKTAGQEIFNYIYCFVTNSNVPLHKLVSITTSRAKSKTDQVNGCIVFCRQHDNFSDIHSPAKFGKQETQYKDCNGHSFQVIS